MSKRKRPVAIKRCDCRTPQTCEHPWWTPRLKIPGAPRQRVNLTKLFPGESVEVAAARAKEFARKGLIRNGELVTAPSADTRLTCRYVATKYKEARADKAHHYLEGLLDTKVPSADGPLTTHIGDKPID